MKTITIKLTEEELETFAKARGYQDTIQNINEETGEYEEVEQDINSFTEKTIEQIIKGDSINYIRRATREQAEQSIQETIQGIQNKDIDISIK